MCSGQNGAPSLAGPGLFGPTRGPEAVVRGDGRLTAVTAKGLRPGMKVVTGKGATGQ